MAVIFRMEEKEETILKEEAKSRGMSLSRYARWILSKGRGLSQKEIVLSEEQWLAFVDLSKNLSRIGGNLNQLSRAVNQGVCLDESSLAQAHSHLRDELRKTNRFFQEMRRQLCQAGKS